MLVALRWAFQNVSTPLLPGHSVPLPSHQLLCSGSESKDIPRADCLFIGRFNLLEPSRFTEKLNRRSTDFPSVPLPCTCTHSLPHHRSLGRGIWYYGWSSQTHHSHQVCSRSAVFAVIQWFWTEEQTCPPWLPWLDQLHCLEEDALATPSPTMGTWSMGWFNWSLDTRSWYLSG